MAQYHVIGCAKHFPGHGDTATDSHYGLPIVNKSLSTLYSGELKPYEIVIDKGIEMIMTAHILYPQLESDKIVSKKTGKAESLPATMSDDILTGLLKDKLGFDGIIITDAMNMAGISDKWDPVQSVVIAIQAGVDMVCMPCRLYCKQDLKNLDAIINGVISAVNTGVIPVSRINDAVTRILTVKENRGILDYNPSNFTLEKAKAVVGCDVNRKMEREIAAAAVTVIKNKNHTLPLKLTANSKILMLMPYSNEQAQMLMAWNRAKEAGLVPTGAKVDYFRFSNSTVSDELKTKLNWADTYIIISEVSSPGRMANQHWLSAMPNQLCDYAAKNGKKAVIASCDKPYDVQLYPNADAVLAAYGCKGSGVDPTEALLGGVTGSAQAYGPNIIAAVEVALGVFGAQGKLPLSIPQYDKNSNSYTGSVLYARGYGLTYDSLLQRNVSVQCIGDMNYMADGNVVTVNHRFPCKIGYPNGSGYVLLKAVKNSNGSYSYTVPSDVIQVVLAVKGDVIGDGLINIGSVSKIYAHIRETTKLADDVLFAADISGDGHINTGDVSRLYAHIKKTTLIQWDT
jgi:beta-N-acetylhexosaminidase